MNVQGITSEKGGHVLPDFGKWLKGRRKQLGVAQKDLARAASCSVMTIVKIEAGERRPSRQIAGMLANYFAVPTEEREAFIEFARLPSRQDGAGDQGPAASREPWRYLIKSPALQAWQRPSSNLPSQHTAFIGREELVAGAQGTLSRPGTRLVTLTGPPGIGKTRLAIEVAARIAPDFAHGVVFVPLASVSIPELVGPAIARAIGLRDVADAPSGEALGEGLARRQLLLVLDNFEQVLGAGTLVSELLTRAPGVKVLATSREALDLYAEREIEVPPLALPGLPGALERAAIPSVEELVKVEAVRLFLDRAQAARYDFEIRAENAVSVAAICTRLDGLPLAIELAAGRVKEVPPEVILARLDSRLALLSQGPRDMPQRQRTLRDAVDWSYDLLGEGEKGLFRRLSLFAGGCTAEDAASVCSPDGDPHEIEAALRSLAHKSLLRVVTPQDGSPNLTRFVMLETIRAYASERLDTCGELPGARKRYASYFLDLAERAEGGLRGAEQLAWLDRLEIEHDNLRVALQLSISSGNPDEVRTALGIAGALWRFWLVRGYGREGLGYLQEALGADPGLVEDDKAASLRAKALNGAGVLSSTQGQYHVARGFFNEGLHIQRSLGDRHAEAALLSNLGNVARTLGEFEEAWRLQKESLVIRQTLGDKAGMALSLSNLGNAAQLMGRLEEACRYQEESLVLLRELGDQQAIATSLNNQAAVLADLGQTGKARELLEESLRIRRQLGDKRGIGKTLANLGQVLAELGEHSQAVAAQEEGLALHLEVGDKEGVVLSLEGLAFIRAAQEMWRPAVRLWGAAHALREEIQARMSSADQEDYETHLAAARSHLTGEEFNALWQEGASTLAEARATDLLRGLQDS